MSCRSGGRSNRDGTRWVLAGAEFGQQRSPRSRLARARGGAPTPRARSGPRMPGPGLLELFLLVGVRCRGAFAHGLLGAEETGGSHAPYRGGSGCSCTCRRRRESGSGCGARAPTRPGRRRAGVPRRCDPWSCTGSRGSVPGPSPRACCPTICEDAQRLVRQLLGAIEVAEHLLDPGEISQRTGQPFLVAELDAAGRGPPRGSGGPRRSRRVAAGRCPAPRGRTPSRPRRPGFVPSSRPRLARSRARSVSPWAITRFAKPGQAGDEVVWTVMCLLARWRPRTSDALRPGSRRSTTTSPTPKHRRRPVRRSLASGPVGPVRCLQGPASASRKLSSSISARPRASRCWNRRNESSRSATWR